MRLEDEGEKLGAVSSVENADGLPRKAKIRHTREFLLSFSDLDACKKLPEGFEDSVLSEFESPSNNERQKNQGGLLLHSVKRSDYGLLPSRSDNSSNYSRGGSCRWDTHSTGSSDRDGDSQSDRETLMQDSGRRFGSQSRRSWQNSEHDGLLGSGAFPRPTGYVGASAPKGRGNGHYQLNRSSEPYHPPRPYKAVPYSRKDATDAVNDETFGSAECSSQDRAEEERKRRESFELMRKEQQKALQEKQKQIPDKHNKNEEADIIALLHGSQHHTITKNENKLEESVVSSHAQSDFPRSSHVHTSSSRPLVPPGFASAVAEKKFHAQGTSSCMQEAGIVVAGDSNHMDHPDSGHEKGTDSVSGVIKQSVDHESDPSNSKIVNLQGTKEVWENDIISMFSNKKELGSDIQSASILDKLFGGALPMGFGSSPSTFENQGTDLETRNPSVNESSKFAHWFLEEEKKPVEDLSSKDLLSLIVNEEKVTPQVSEHPDDGDHEPNKASLPFGNNETIQKHHEFSVNASAGIPESHYPTDNRESSSGVLTCEDLELQFIMAEARDGSSVLQQSAQEPCIKLNNELGEQKTSVDDHASQHLLSLLQKGVNSKESVPSTGIEVMISSMEIMDISDVKATLDIDTNTIKNSDKVQSSGGNLTLGSVFGAAFMNELHSVGAPVSAQRGSIGRIPGADAPQFLESRLPYEEDLFSSSHDGAQSSNITNKGHVEAFSHNLEAKSEKIPGIWLESGESSAGGVSKRGNLGMEEVAANICLPEEDSLITVGDSLDSITSDPPTLRNLSRNQEPLELKAEQFNDPILMAILRDSGRARQGHLPPPNVLDGPSDILDSDKFYHHAHGRSLPQFPQHVNQMRPLFPQMDHHMNMNCQMRFMGPEIGVDPHHPFSSNVFPQHALNSANRPQFDPSGHYPLFQQIPVAGNLSPQHSLQGLPRGVPISYPMNHMPGYMPEVNNMHGFPLNPRPPNFGSQGIGMPGHLMRGGNPQAFDRLIEMELRANNSKQIQPAAAGHIPGIYGPKLDMGFRYR